MDCYENLGIIGEGSYGKVLKCIHKETKHVVAIKKFLDSDDDKVIKKIALREIQMLKKLRHENLVNLLDVFRRKKRLYLVFEFLDRTVLDDLEKNPDGLDDVDIKKISIQVLRGLDFCHSHNVIHRDIKPENILISKSGVVKLCDFGFARTLVVGPGEVFTDYVATRWYRAPELLVGDASYGKAVDIWAIGCLLFEMATGNPLFPGDSDIDQLFRITKKLGNLTDKHKDIFLKNPGFTGISLPNVTTPEMFNDDVLIGNLFDLMMKCLLLDAHSRPSCADMMNHPYFKEKDFSTIFMEQLKDTIAKEAQATPFLKKNKKKTVNSSIETYRNTKGSKEHPLVKLSYYPYINSSNITKKTDVFFPAKPNEALGKLSTGDSGLKKTIESEQAESKSRPTFDVTINSFGKNLPDLHNNGNNRLFANDFQKQIMGNLRKSNMSFETLNSNFLNKAEGFQIEKNVPNDKFVETMSQKKKKKRKKKECLENANKSNFLPSVIGPNVNAKNNLNKVAAVGIHLSNASQSSNTDSFINTGKKETPPGSRRIQSNLPAV